MVWPWAQVKYQYSASSERKKKADIEDEVGMMNPVCNISQIGQRIQTPVHMTPISLATPVFRNYNTATELDALAGL